MNYENQVILLTISNEEKKGWHYLVVKKLSTLLRAISSKHHSCFYCLNCLHCFRIRNKRKSHEKVCKNKVFCRNVIASEKDIILKLNQYIKYDKMPYIIYSNSEPLIKIVNVRIKNNLIRKINAKILQQQK